MPFEDRTPGDLLEEFYFHAATEWDALRSTVAELSVAQLDRLRSLEDILEPSERKVLYGASQAQAAQAWNQVRRTGDPLGDYWEYRAVHGLITAADFERKQAPPESEWDEA